MHCQNTLVIVHLCCILAEVYVYKKCFQTVLIFLEIPSRNFCVFNQKAHLDIIPGIFAVRKTTSQVRRAKQQ